MKIIKMGIVPEPKVMSSTCRNCTTQFEYDKRDVQLRKKGNDIVKCPLCQEEITPYYVMMRNQM